MEEFWKKVSKGKENIRFYQSASYSPYSEFSQNWIEEKNGLTWLGVNSFYRYDSIIKPLFATDKIGKRRKDWIFDIYMHYLTELEYRNGMTSQEFCVRKYWIQLEKGLYGNQIKEIFSLLSDEHKYYIAHSLWRQSETRESVDRFSDVLVSVLENGIVYKNKWDEKQLILYISKRENEDDIKKITLIEQLFQPLGYKLSVLWERHFAVLGEQQTMIIDEIELL